MNRAEIYARINNFAPPELAENWDCSGVLVESNEQDIKKIMLTLTVTDDIVEQAFTLGCDMIVSHHPLFFVPMAYKNINIFCTHTNLDKTEGGTTDTLVKKSGFEISDKLEFLRFADCDISVEELAEKLRNISPHLRYVNNKIIKKIKRVAFCAGSGSEFINEAKENGANAMVTGDLKFHTALDSDIVVYDIGHFESEIIILPVLAKLFPELEIIYAKEKSPFIFLQ